MSTSELRIRLAADGRIECRKGDAAPAITLDPDFFGNPESAEAQRALGRFVFAVLQGVTPAADADALQPPTRTARTRCTRTSSRCRAKR